MANGSEHLAERRPDLFGLGDEWYRNRGAELLATHAWRVGEFKETVALGFCVYAGHMSWEFLHNVAAPDVADRTFDVDGAEVKNLLRQYGRPLVMWHSHSLSVEPSETDLESFPTWLTKLGVVYHAPSGQTTLYDASGVISPSNVDDHSPLATPHNQSI